MALYQAKLERFKVAAIELCMLRGLDPHERVGHGAPGGFDVMLYSPRWELAVGELEDALRVQQALKLVQ